MIAVLDKNGELATTKDKIEQVTLEHFVNLFKNNEPENNVKPPVNLLNEFLVKRMDEKDEDEEPMKVTKEEFDDTFTNFKKKNKRNDDFL